MKNKTFIFLKKVLKHELVSGSFYLFIGVVISGFLGFIVNLFFARNLSKPDYGIYASLLSLITLFTIPASSLTPILVKFAGNFHAKGETEQLRRLYFQATKLFSFLAIVVFILFIIFTPFLRSFLNLDSFWYILIVGITVSFAYLGIVNGGFLQGLLRFGFIAFTQVSSAALRLIVGVCLVFLGFNVFGAVSSAFFSIFSALLLGFFPLSFLIKNVRHSENNFPIKDLVKYGIPTSITILSLFSFISTDVILVRHFLTPFEAGLYGGLALVGKVVYYFTGPIPTVMFPLLIKRHAKSEPFNKLFYLALLLVLIPSALIVGFYYIYPAFTTIFFLGKGYEEIIPFVALYGAYIGIFSLLNVCVNLFLSLNKTKIFIPVLIGAILQILLISLFHQNFYEIIFISIIITCSLFLGLITYFLKTFFILSQKFSEK